MSDTATSHVSKKVSSNAISRVLALQASEFKAARLMASLQVYPDFFSDYVEKGGGPGPWHEFFPDIIIGHPPFEEIAFSHERMVPIDALQLNAKEGYSDFFVEGGGGSWHEAFTDVITADAQSLAVNPSARVAALSRSNVLRAYSTLKAGGFSKE